MRHAPVIALLLLLGAGRAAGEAREVRLMIGPDRAVVRELREVAFTGLVHEVTFSDLPAAANLETLQVGGARQGVRLLRWSRVPGRAAAPAVARWVPGSALREDARAPEGTEVRCVLETSSLRARQVELVYQVRGLSWAADYEITVRGDVANHLEPLSLDLEGRIILSNATGRAFADARVLLVNEEQPGAAAAPRDAGVLLLDDWSPLADLWRKKPVQATVPHGYPLPDAVSLPPVGAVSVAFVRTRRQSAGRLYSMQSDAFPVDAGGAWRPLTRFITLRNDAANGLGPPLPPGEALIYLGGVRGGLYQRARLAHTARDGEVRISLGPSRSVTASRVAEPRVAGAAGMPEQTMLLKLANALPTAVNVEVVERPPVPLAWDLVRSSSPCEKRGPSLFFALSVEPRSEAAVSFTVRMAEPAP